MIDLDQVKVTPRDQQVLNLLVQGCSNKEIAGQLNISPRTVKQHLRTLFLRAGIREGRKRVKLAIAMFSKRGASVMTPRESLTAKEIQIAILVWEGLTNREIGRLVGTSEQVIKNHLRSIFDKLGVWSRLELAMYDAGHGAKIGLRLRMSPCHRQLEQTDDSPAFIVEVLLSHPEATMQKVSREVLGEAANSKLRAIFSVIWNF